MTATLNTDMPFSGSGERNDLVDCDRCGFPVFEDDAIFLAVAEELLCPNCCEDIVLGEKPKAGPADPAQYK